METKDLPPTFTYSTTEKKSESGKIILEIQANTNGEQIGRTRVDIGTDGTVDMGMVYVQPDQRQKGFGEQLFQYAVQKASQRGGKLYVNSIDNPVMFGVVYRTFHSNRYYEGLTGKRISAHTAQQLALEGRPPVVRSTNPVII